MQISFRSPSKLDRNTTGAYLRVPTTSVADINITASLPLSTTGHSKPECDVVILKLPEEGS